MPGLRQSQLTAELRVGLIVVLVLAWGTVFAAVKIGLEAAPPLLFGGLRYVVGGLVLVAIALVRGDAPRLRGHLAAYGILTLLNVVIFFGLQTLAIEALPSGLAAVLIYLQPVLVGVLAWPLLGEPLTGRKILGLLLGFGGIVAVSAGAFSGHASGLGIGYAVAGALTWALGTIYFKRVSDRVTALWAVALPFLLGGVVLTAVGLVREGPQITWDVPFVLALLYSALVGTALAWMLWFTLVAAGDASRAATYVFFVPLLSLTLGALLLHESLSATLLLGATLVVAGVYLANRPERDKTR